MPPTAHSLREVHDLDSLRAYLETKLGWPIEGYELDDLTYVYEPEELGIDPKHAVKIKSIRELRKIDGDEPWGLFFLEFEAKRLPVVVMRRILRSLVASKRSSNAAADRKSWQMRDLLFIAATGEKGHRGLTFAHFREVRQHHVAQLRTFGWDETETQFAPLESKLAKLRWDNQPEWNNAWTLAHGQLVGDSKQLASKLALFAREIRKQTLDLYNVETDDGQLHTLYKAFQGALIADMKPEGFADTVAQTVTYGLFAGRATGATLQDIGLSHLETFIPKTNPFLRELFAQFTRLGFDISKAVDFDDLGIVDLVEFLNRVPVREITENFGRQSGGGIEDPVVYFYENFLKEYDEKQRVQRGVYYTPKPVVDFIVRGVHQLLIDELDCPDGLADLSKHKVNGKDEFKVMILDPATGTGTFLQSAIEVIYDHLQKKWKSEGVKSEAALKAKWNEYVPVGLLPRLHGFELMMASYTVAHMKLGLKLQELGYEFGSNERLRVFLTNTLEPPHESEQKALNFPDFLAHESHAADKVKGETAISVVIGNPPYAGHSANDGAWIRDLLRSSLPDGADSYFKVDGQDLGERNPKWLNDDYVKFTRYAQFRLAQSPFGVLGFITNHGYLDNPTFRGMRQSLLHTFDQIYQIDLHGNSNRREKTPDGNADENVFDIQQGVSLNIEVRGGKKKKIKHAHQWGDRATKYAFCNSGSLMDAHWNDIVPSKPFYLFIPRDSNLENQYLHGTKVSDIFPVNSLGIATARDAFCVQENSSRVWEIVRDFINLPVESAREKYSLGKDARDWQVKLAQVDVMNSGPKKELLSPILYRPFDMRWTYYTGRSRGFHCMPRNEVMQHVVRNENIAICTTRNIEIERGFEHVFASTEITQLHTVSIKEVNYLFPIYIYPSNSQIALDLDAQLLGFGKGKRRANLSPEFVAQLGNKVGLAWQADNKGNLETKFGPEDVLAYIYAILHAPSYRARYGEFLKSDFPHVPLTSNLSLFRQLVSVGHDLLAIHTLSSSVTATVDTTGLTPSGEIAAGYPKFSDGYVSINQKSGFSNVPENVWRFHIGGYQIAHKWLKDRKGRALTDEDAKHYRLILWSLGETISRVDAIDELIEGAGGFPLVGSMEKIEVDVNRFFD